MKEGCFRRVTRGGNEFKIVTRGRKVAVGIVQCCVGYEDMYVSVTLLLEKENVSVTRSLRSSLVMTSIY